MKGRGHPEGLEEVGRASVLPASRHITSVSLSSSQLYLWSKTTQGISVGVPSEAETTHIFTGKI